jgi:hypothetical protein
MDHRSTNPRISGSAIDRLAVRRVLNTFADAVVAGDASRMCPLLVGRARGQQGCGSDDEDVGPLLSLAIRNRRSIQIVEVGRTTASAAIPDFRPTPAEEAAPDEPGPQVILLEKEGDEWKICGFEFRASWRGQGGRR